MEMTLSLKVLLILFTAAATVFHLTLTKDTDIIIQWVRTAKDNGDKLKVQKNITFGKDFKNETVTVVVKSSTTYQTMVGFGGAFTDSSAFVFSKLNTTLQSNVLDMYFSEKGLRYNMGRLPIGSCDFSLEHYTYDETIGDISLSHFSISHDEDRIIPLIKKAMETRSKWTKEPLNIVASPWGPPSWMKSLKTRYCVSCLECVIADAYKATWALYFSKFISAYKNQSIPIWGITIQNEPGACPLDYEGLHFTPETETDFLVKYLGPVMKKDHPDVKILIYDHNKDKVVKWSEVVYNNSDAASYVWGTAVHWYTGDEFPNLQEAHDKFPKFPILATEATVTREKNPSNPEWSHGEHYAHDMIGDFNNWVVGFIDWNLLLDKYGGPNHAFFDECEGLIKCGSDAMLLADVDQQIIYPQVFYYYVGHMSKYVPAGSRRIDVYIKPSNSSLESTGFITPTNQTVVVVMNASDDPITFKLYNVENKMAANITALAHSIQTFWYKD